MCAGPGPSTPKCCHVWWKEFELGKPRIRIVGPQSRCGFKVKEQRLHSLINNIAVKLDTLEIVNDIQSPLMNIVCYGLDERLRVKEW
jgi:hypothetical protein